MTRRRAGVVLVALALVLGLPSGQAQGADPATFTIVVTPDTQIYVQTAAGAQVFAEQFEWVVAEQANRNIIFVTHVGDVSQDPSSPVEWDRIEPIFGLLDEASIPYGIAPGNHDINDDGSAPEYDARFGVDRYVDAPWFAGHHAAEGNRSSYQTLSIEGHELLFLHVRHLWPRYGDVDAVLDWADSVLAAHPDHLVFLTTHEFTAPDGTVVFPQLQAVVEGHCNVAAIFSGHRTAGAANGEFEDGCGRTVQHVLTNYQHITGGGQGFLRTVEIDRLTLDATFQVYSPTRDEFRNGPSEDFSATLAPLVPVVGDASCNRRLSVADALFTAQFAVGLRTARSSCPLMDPRTEANVASADANQDGQVSVRDALMIAQCSAGVPNALCPE